MRILDEDGIELKYDELDLDLGYLKPDKIFVKHHEAIHAVEEQKHQVVTEYPATGGVDIRWVIDVPAASAVDAWDEYEDVLRYVPYTAEELAEREAREREEYEKSPEYRIAELEAALDLLLSGVTE